MRGWVLAAFASQEALLEGLRALREAQLGPLDAHTPFPVEEVDAVLGLSPSPLPRVGLLAGVGGAVGAYGVQWFTQAVDWPLLIGNRPFHSAPVWVPITFETAVLAAASTLFLGVFALSGLPHLSHPFFRLEAFRSATQDAFWASVGPLDEEEAVRAEALLQARGAQVVSRLEEEA